jgi:hypothetical protein
LILVGAARAARDDAQQLRTDALGLRFAARRGVRSSHAAITAAAVTATSARARRTSPIVSPWSGLAWLADVESIERVLVPVD